MLSKATSTVTVARSILAHEAFNTVHINNVNRGSIIQIFQLQAAAAQHDDPGQLLASLVERYGVTEWFKTGCPRPYAEDEIARKMANSCLQLILALIAERYE